MLHGVWTLRHAGIEALRENCLSARAGPKPSCVLLIPSVISLIHADGDPTALAYGLPRGLAGCACAHQQRVPLTAARTCLLSLFNERWIMLDLPWFDLVPNGLRGDLHDVEDKKPTNVVDPDGENVHGLQLINEPPSKEQDPHIHNHLPEDRGKQQLLGWHCREEEADGARGEDEDGG